MNIKNKAIENIKSITDLKEEGIDGTNVLGGRGNTVAINTSTVNKSFDLKRGDTLYDEIG